MSIETAFRRLRDVNPVPDPKALRAGLPAMTDLLAATEQRSSTMSTEVRPTVRESSQVRKPTIRIAAAFAAVLVGVTVAVVLWNRPSTTASRTPAEVADLFLTSVQAGDVGTSSDLLAPDASIDDLQARSIDDWAGRLEWATAVDLTFEFGICEETVVDETHLFGCPYVFGGGWSTAQGLQSSGTGTYRITVEAGQVTLVSNVWMVDDAGQSSWFDFHDFVDSNYPEDLAVMYTPDGVGNPIPNLASLTPESIELWRSHIQEFKAEMGRP